MKLLRILCIILLLIIALSAFAGGYVLMTDPSGRSLSLYIDYLQHSPFKDYLIPGLILFIANGISGLIVFGTVIIRYKYYPWFIAYQGGVLVGWIVTQIIMLQITYFLQFLFGAVGILLIILGIVQASPKNSLIKK